MKFSVLFCALLFSTAHSFAKCSNQRDVVVTTCHGDGLQYKFDGSDYHGVSTYEVSVCMNKRNGKVTLELFPFAVLTNNTSSADFERVVANPLTSTHADTLEARTDDNRVQYSLTSKVFNNFLIKRHNMGYMLDAGKLQGLEFQAIFTDGPWYGGHLDGVVYCK